MPQARTVLLTGASGFIGRRLHEQLLARGHAVVAIARHPPAQGDERTRWHALGLAGAVDPATWAPLLAGVDVVVNAAGIFRESRAASFEAVQKRLTPGFERRLSRPGLVWVYGAFAAGLATLRRR